MDDGRPSPEESLDSLKRRVDDAKLRLDFASAYVKEVESDDRSGRILSKYPEVYERAFRAHRSATLQYLRVLKIYESFVARGKAAHNGAGQQEEKANGGTQLRGAIIPQTVESIQRRIHKILADCITVRTENAHFEEWRTGVKGAILEGRITILQELLAWMEA